MSKDDDSLYEALESELAEVHGNVFPLPGIDNEECREAFIRQIIDSIHRVNYVYKIRSRPIGESRCDPSSTKFDPIKAAILEFRHSNIDEAVWLIFLSTHFGKHRKYGWQMMREVYCGPNSGDKWAWERICKDVSGFAAWFRDNYSANGGVFGNHRKYESIRPDANRNLIKVIETYIDWVGSSCSHIKMLGSVKKKFDSDPRKMFSFLYRTMDGVVSFGRTARFDFLTMLGKTGIVDIVPDSPYLRGATGPLTGAKLLLSGDVSASANVSELEGKLSVLNDVLSIGEMGMQVLEDSLCNWQKKPNKHIRFRG